MTRPVNLLHKQAQQGQGRFRNGLAALHYSDITFRHRRGHHLLVQVKRSGRDKHKAPTFGTGAEGGRFGKRFPEAERFPEAGGARGHSRRPPPAGMTGNTWKSRGSSRWLRSIRALCGCFRVTFMAIKWEALTWRPKGRAENTLPHARRHCQ